MNTQHEKNLLLKQPISTTEYSIIGIAVLIFICLGVFLSWMAAVLILVGLMITAFILYIILKKVDERQIKKIREVYENERKAKAVEGCPIIGGDAPRRISAEEGDRADRIIADALAGRIAPGERSIEDKPVSEEPRRSNEIPVSGSSKNKKRSKPNRFAPV